MVYFSIQGQSWLWGLTCPLTLKGSECYTGVLLLLAQWAAWFLNPVLTLETVPFEWHLFPTRTLQETSPIDEDALT